MRVRVRGQRPLSICDHLGDTETGLSGGHARDCGLRLRLDPQSIQYFHAWAHLTDPADWGNDNSLALVAGKPTLVRVFAGALHTQPKVQCKLTVERLGAGGARVIVPNVQAVELGPDSYDPAVIEIQSSISYDDQRAHPRRSFNFEIPSVEARGRLRIRAVLEAPMHCQTFPSAETEVVINPEVVLPVAILRFSYTGPSPHPSGPRTLNLPAPTMDEAIRAFAKVLPQFPISRVDFRDLGTAAVTASLSSTPSSSNAGAGWPATMAALENASVADGERGSRTYVGMINGLVDFGWNGIAVGDFVIGRSLTIGIVAHEIGHVLGLEHAPCGNPANVDPTFPVFEPYAPASTGEYGFDSEWRRILDPNSWSDLMSYCSPRWLSVTNYRRIANLHGTSVLPATTISLPDAPKPERSNHLLLSGVLDEDGGCRVETVHRVFASVVPGRMRQTRLQAELLDADGEKLAWTWLEVPPQVCPAAAGPAGNHCRDEVPGPMYFRALVPWHPDARTLRIRREREVLFERHRPERDVAISRLRVQVRRGHLSLAWNTLGGRRGAGSFTVYWHPLDGADLRVAAAEVDRSACRIPLARLTRGPIRVYVVAHDGFATLAAAHSGVSSTTRTIKCAG